MSSVAKQRGVTMKGVKAGAKIVQKAAKKAAPRRKKVRGFALDTGSGALRQSLGFKAAKGRRGKTLAYAVIGARKKVRKTVRVGGRTIIAVPAFYAHLVEKGTRPHSLGKGAKLARRGKAAANVVGKQHPGARPQPFLGPAYRQNQGVIANAMTAEMGEAVRKELEKAAQKVAKGVR